MKKRKSVKGIICIVALCRSELHIKVELLVAHFLTYYPIIVPLILIRLCRHNTTLHSLGWAETHYKVCEMLPLIHMYLSSLICLSLQIENVQNAVLEVVVVLFWGCAILPVKEPSFGRLGRHSLAENDLREWEDVGSSALTKPLRTVRDGNQHCLPDYRDYRTHHPARVSSS